MKFIAPLLSGYSALLVAGTILGATPAALASLLRPADRIVFIGDSITGQGANSSNGWTHMIEESLRTTYPDFHCTFVSLGGSGQSVASWMNVEKRSRDQTVILDVKNVDVRAELGRRADVVVCMLGMNDVLFPQIKDSPEDYERWAGRYRELIRSLRERTRPRVFALATPTLCTEDLASPKNRVMASLIERIATLASEENCVVLPTNQTMREILAKGRVARPDFHVTGDFVHPNPAGHVAIAVGMLRGLGEVRASDALLEKHAPVLFKPVPISYQIERITPTNLASVKETFRLRVFDHTDSPAPARARLTLPPGWTQLTPDAGQPADIFMIEGVPDRLTNRVRIDLGEHATTLDIPAPWLIGIAHQSTSGWSAKGFDPEACSAAADAWFSHGERFGESVEPEPGQPLHWNRHIASINYGGGASPGAIDLAAITFFQNFDVAYGVRWIHCPDTRPATLQIERLGFAADSYLAVWLNGKKLHAAPLAAAAKTDYAVTLAPGWNALVFRSHNFQVQWQFALNLKSENPETLRIATSPPSS